MGFITGSWKCYCGHANKFGKTRKPGALTPVLMSGTCGDCGSEYRIKIMRVKGKAEYLQALIPQNMTEKAMEAVRTLMAKQSKSELKM